MCERTTHLRNTRLLANNLFDLFIRTRETRYYAPYIIQEYGQTENLRRLTSIFELGIDNVSYSFSPQVINSYLALIESNGGVFCHSTYFYSKYSRYGYDAVKKWTKRTGIVSNERRVLEKDIKYLST